jgi:hypothetical protein
MSRKTSPIWHSTWQCFGKIIDKSVKPQLGKTEKAGTPIAGFCDSEKKYN